MKKRKPRRLRYFYQYTFNSDKEIGRGNCRSRYRNRESILNTLEEGIRTETKCNEVIILSLTQL